MCMVDQVTSSLCSFVGDPGKWSMIVDMRTRMPGSIFDLSGQWKRGAIEVTLPGGEKKYLNRAKGAKGAGMFFCGACGCTNAEAHNGDDAAHPGDVEDEDRGALV